MITEIAKRCGMPPITESTEYADFIRGKSVAVVGPAETIKGSNQRDRIESCDLVVRMNKALPIHPEVVVDTGDRCDLFYHCMSENPADGGKINKAAIRAAGVKWFCSPYPEMEIFARDFVSFRENHSDIGIPFHSIGKNLFLWMRDELKSRPNTGMCIIADLLHSGVGSIYVTGFTFFETQYVRSYRNIPDNHMNFLANEVTHRQPPQKEWFFDMVKKSGVIFLDDFLTNMDRGRHNGEV